MASAATVQAGSQKQADDAYQAAVSTANSIYAAAVASAQTAFATNLQDFQGDKSSSTLPDFVWPDAPPDNAVVVPDDSTQPKPPLAWPTYDGPAFDPTVDPGYQQAVAAAHAVHDDKVAVADGELADARYQAQNEYDSNLSGAQQRYQDSLTTAENQYYNSVQNIPLPNDPQQTWDLYQSKRQAAYDQYNSDVQAAQDECSAKENAAWDKCSQATQDAWNKYEQACENAQPGDDLTGAWLDMIDADADAQCTCNQTCDSAVQKCNDKDSAAAKTECDRLADADHGYALQMDENQEAEIEGLVRRPKSPGRRRGPGRPTLGLRHRRLRAIARPTTGRRRGSLCHHRRRGRLPATARPHRRQGDRRHQLGNAARQ